MGVFLIETSFTDNKHAVSLYKPQISVTHSHLDTLSRISQQRTNKRTNTHTHTHAFSDAVQR